MARHVQVAIDCADPARLAVFWADVLGYHPQPLHDESGEWSLIGDPAGIGPPLFFHRVPERKVVKNRVHLDLRVAPDASDDERRPLVDAEAARLVGIGAIHVRTDDDESDYYAVMQDPEGNEFCVG